MMKKLNYLILAILGIAFLCSTKTAKAATVNLFTTPTPVPSNTPAVSPKPSSAVSPTPAASGTPAPSITPAASVSPSITPTPKADPSPTPEPTVSISPTPTEDPTPTPVGVISGDDRPMGGSDMGLNTLIRDITKDPSIGQNMMNSVMTEKKSPAAETVKIEKPLPVAELFRPDLKDLYASGRINPAQKRNLVYFAFMLIVAGVMLLIPEIMNTAFAIGFQKKLGMYTSENANPGYAGSQSSAGLRSNYFQDKSGINNTPEGFNYKL